MRWENGQVQEKNYPESLDSGQEIRQNFSFLLDLIQAQIQFSPALAHYLGYSGNIISSFHVLGIVPKEEYAKLNRVHRLLQKIYESNPTICLQAKFILIHSVNRVGSGPLRILRELYFVRTKLGNSKVLYCYNNCVDITNLHFTKGILFDAVFPKHLAHERAEILQRFEPILNTQALCFSKRQLEVIQVWAEMDSLALAARRLNISVRTMETHLRNMRQKIGVRRTIDVLLLAKDNGWV